ncbi:MAG: hypothetical protein R2838_15665 [Caldilineaceae bacterium]
MEQEGRQLAGFYFGFNGSGQSGDAPASTTRRWAAGRSTRLCI